MIFSRKVKLDVANRSSDWRETIYMRKRTVRKMMTPAAAQSFRACSKVYYAVSISRRNANTRLTIRSKSSLCIMRTYGSVFYDTYSLYDSGLTSVGNTSLCVGRCRYIAVFLAALTTRRSLGNMYSRYTYAENGR